MTMIGLFGCQQAEEIKSSDEKLRMSIEASIGDDGKVAGRTSLGNDGSVSFADNDEIGLFVKSRSVVRWIYDKDKNKWNSNGNVFWDNKVDEHKFYAFYPYVDGATLGNVPMPNLAEQTGEMADIDDYDFLFATKTQSYGGDGVVSFLDDNAFEHVFSLIRITLQGEGDLVGSEINEITINGEDIVAPRAYSFIDSNVVPLSEGDEGVDNLNLILTNLSLGLEGHTFYFVVNTGAELKDVDLKISYTKDNKNYIATLQGMNTDETEREFESGKQYSYSLKVMDGVLTVSGNTIKSWTNGVDMSDIIINREEEQPKPES
jgi:hypothetical protein